MKFDKFQLLFKQEVVLLISILVFLVAWLYTSEVITTPMRLSVYMQSDLNGHAQLFWKNSWSSNYSESRSFSVNVQKNDTFVKHTFELPFGVNLRNLRLDPIDNNGHVVIGKMEFVVQHDKAEEKILVLTPNNISSFANLRQVVKNDQIQLTATSNDPMLFINIPYEYNQSSLFGIISSTAFLRVSNPEIKFNLICGMLLSLLILQISRQIKQNFLSVGFIFALALLAAFFTSSFLNALDFPIQHFSSAVGHMNYYGLSKLKDQVVLYSFILLIPLYFYIIYRLTRRKG